MKAISFLGTTDYKNTDYKFPGGKLIHTRFFPVAVNNYYQPDEHYVFMTEDARSMHSQRLSEMIKFNEVIIPLGRNEDQFWEIFDDILQVVHNDDEVILDFTYGFRSQPVLTIAALIFMKALKNIKIKHVIYGAFEAKENEVVPVFDLTSFIELIDWSYAVNDFTKYGNVNSLSKIMTDIHRNSYIDKHPAKAQQLINKGTLLKNITNALSVVNIKSAFEYASIFPNKMEGLISDLEKIKQTKPLALLFGHIEKRISPISEAENQIFSAKGLKAQLEIIKWYIETNQFQQAITLLCEFFITLKCIEKNLEPDSSESRIKVSQELGGSVQKLRDKKEIENKEEIVLWNKLIEIRNNINHAGMKKKNPDPLSQINEIKELYVKTSDYYMIWSEKF